MSVYAIHAKGTDFVKIGYTRSATASARLSSLASGCPHELVVIGLAVGAPSLIEYILHRHYAPKKVEMPNAEAKCREWFALDPAARVHLSIILSGVRVDGDHEKQVFAFARVKQLATLRRYITDDVVRKMVARWGTVVAT